MLSVVTWKWSAPAPANGRPGDRLGTRYTAEHVNRLAAMVGRHLPEPHQFVCIADDARGLAGGIRYMPGWSGDDHLYRHTRRLRTFSAEMAELLGPRILMLDLDTVILGDLTPLVEVTAPLALWRCPSLRTASGLVYNPSVALFDAGYLDPMWRAFATDPDGTVARARKNGWRNSDQAVINDWITEHALPVHAWTDADGLYSFRDAARHWPCAPPDARLVGFYDPRYDPSMTELHAEHPWIAEHWRA